MKNGHRKVLLAEGEPRQLRFCATELEREGYRVIPASTDEEVLQKIESERPDVVVLDLRLPTRGGVETLNSILEEEDSPPVILTSRCGFWDESFAIWMADACVTTSADLAELKKALRGVLAKKFHAASRGA